MSFKTKSKVKITPVQIITNDGSGRPRVYQNYFTNKANKTSVGEGFCSDYWWEWIKNKQLISEIKTKSKKLKNIG